MVTPWVDNTITGFDDHHNDDHHNEQLNEHHNVLTSRHFSARQPYLSSSPLGYEPPTLRPDVREPLRTDVRAPLRTDVMTL